MPLEANSVSLDGAKRVRHWGSNLFFPSAYAWFTLVLVGFGRVFGARTAVLSHAVVSAVVLLEVRMNGQSRMTHGVVSKRVGTG